MKFAELLAAKAADIYGAKEPVIAFLGDSVTQGCFEVYDISETAVETVYEGKKGYAEKLSQIFSVLYPNVPVGIINAGVSGCGAPNGLERLERDVLCHKPDLVVVCFGLNDCGNGKEKIGVYLDALKGIFQSCREAGAEVLFMTPNMMNTRVIEGTEERFYAYAHVTAEIQNGGRMDTYMDAAKALAKSMGVKVADCYAKWKELAKTQDTTALLANYINHPNREMHQLFADTLFDVLFEGTEFVRAESQSTMYRGE